MRGNLAARGEAQLRKALRVGMAQNHVAIQNNQPGSARPGIQGVKHGMRHRKRV